MRLTIVGALLLSTAVQAAPPNVVATNPARNSMAPARTGVAITFDQPLLRSSITKRSFRVFGRVSGVATGSVALSNGDKTVTLTPSRPFSAGERVLVNFSHDVRAADSSRLRGAGYAFEFTIRAAPAQMVFETIDVMSNRTGGPSGSHTQIYGAAQADLDRDGWVDLATVNEVSADVRVFMNRADGTGLYQQPFVTPVPVGPEASPNETGDFDGDGRIDLAITSVDGGGVWIALGKGDGTFKTPQAVLTGDRPHGLVVLDVDGDGDMDIVEAVYGGNTLALLVNDGTGVFEAPVYFPAGCGWPWGLASADMNEDGIVDVIAGCDQRIAVSLGNGDGTFTPAPSQDAGGSPWQVAVGDVDGDGHVDAAVANAFQDVHGGALLHGNGDGTFGAPTFVLMPGHTPASDLGDLDGDGDLDWILSSYAGRLWRIYVNDGHGNFSFGQDIAAPSNPSCAVLLDFDNDGDIDLALSDEIADVVVLAQNANPVSAPLCPPTPAACRTTVRSRRSSLMLKDKPSDDRDRIVWKWAGEATAKADFGNPRFTDDYALCLYDVGVLVARATADAGGTCPTKPCWKEKPTGFAYKDKASSPSGARWITLEEGLVAGKARIVFKGKGAQLSMPPPASLAGPVSVRLHRSGAATCWGADFSAPFLEQDATGLRDKSN